MKYEYKFVKLTSNQNYEAVIEEYAKKGWRFIQIFVPKRFKFFYAVEPSLFVLIFERPVKE